MNIIITKKALKFTIEWSPRLLNLKTDIIDGKNAVGT